jgi:hypothetical protein
LKLLGFVRCPYFSFWAPLNYQGADIRADRFRSKRISAPKGLA